MFKTDHTNLVLLYKSGSMEVYTMFYGHVSVVHKANKNALTRNKQNQKCLFVCLFGCYVAFNIICHITTMSGCDREPQCSLS